MHQLQPPPAFETSPLPLQGYQYSWCVDPLDGTKEFLKRNGQFTVNIALLRVRHAAHAGQRHAQSAEAQVVGNCGSMCRVCRHALLHYSELPETS